MTIPVKLLNDQIKKVSDTNTFLDMLLEFERVLDEVDLYAYKNWELGEILEGPDLQRHFVSVKLLYPYKDMPDPNGAKRLFAKDCTVKYTKDELISPVKVRSFDDIETTIRADGTTHHRAKTITKPVWVIEIVMPRRYVDEDQQSLADQDSDDYIDPDSLGAEEVANSEQLMNGDFGAEEGI